MSASRLSDLPLSDDPQQVLAHSPASTSCLPITVWPIPGQGHRVHDHHPTPRIYVAQQGHGHRRYRRGSQDLLLRTEPGMIEMYEAGLTFEECDWSGEPGRCVEVEFTDEDVFALTHGELKSLRLETRHECFDAQVSALALDLAEEALRGQPEGRMYSQGMCLTLLGLLASRYQAEPRQAAALAHGRLGETQARKVVDLIHASPSTDLSVRRLADEVGLSPFHFARVFKETFGVSPHRYVQSHRLEAAARALQTDRRESIANVALACGFASQSHMTDLMRRRWGVTPRQLRSG